MSIDEKVFTIPEDLIFPKEYEQYFSEILEKLRRAYEVALRARAKGYDPVPFPEVKIASDLASRVEAMVGPPGIAERIRGLLREGKEVEEIAFIIAREIAEGKYGIGDSEQRANQAIKTATAILVGGITAAPLEGITHVKIRPTGHLAVYYAGPIRSAGGTETALTVVIADVVRRALGLPEYNASDREIERFVEEVVLYNRYSSLQYPVDRDKIVFALKHLPVEITGEGTLDVEVSGPYRNLPNIETSKIRGGAVLVLNDGIIAKAKKVLKIVKRCNIDGWEWLEDLVKLNKDEEGEGSNKSLGGNKVTVDTTYLSDVIAGRPVFSSPSRIGGFRLRYGRSRNTGLAAVGIHPATMVILSEFLAVGTQIKTERPGKGAIVMPVDSIHPPIVKLRDGSVVCVQNIQEAKKLLDEIEKVLFLGDVLVAIGEFLENNHIILPSPIVEEWWVQELYDAIRRDERGEVDFSDIIKRAREDPIFAFKLTRELGIPLHPRWTYFWRNITASQLIVLKKAIMKAQDNILPYERDIKSILEKLFVPHKVSDNKIILAREDFEALYQSLVNIPDDIKDSLNGLELINKAGLRVFDKFSVFIGARMGRPEKAKPRMMKPPVHVLFPVGLIGSRSRSIIRAASNRVSSEVEAVNKWCPRCGIHTYENICPKCGRRTQLKYVCPKCGSEYDSKGVCPRCKSSLLPYRKYRIDFAKILHEKASKLKIKLPKDVKGVIGLTSRTKMPEPLEKGLLRGKYDLFVFKDGTIRFDATDAPLTHFKPREIGVSVEVLKKLGYTHDVYGRPLENEDQILELKVQDIIINEDCAEFFVRVAQFIDDLLEKFYGLPKFYNIKNKEDLLGHLVVGLAPHTSAGIIGRIIGFTKAQCTFAHPYWHAAKRRNCDGDEDALMLVLDVLINFSREFLPKSRGGMMDAPLVITSILNPLEVDSEVYNMDTMRKIPLEFYRKSLKYPSPDEIEELISNIEKKLGSSEQYRNFDYSHETLNISGGPLTTSYKKLKSMKEKIELQFNVMSKIAAIELKEISDKILEVHLFPDIMGNLRAYGSQQFRCISCNMKLRRIPLSGKCPRCGGRIVQTIYRKTVLKYAPVAKQIIRKYGASEYNIQRYNIFELTDFKFLASAAESEKLEDIFDKAEKLIGDEKKTIAKGKNILSLEDFFV